MSQLQQHDEYGLERRVQAGNAFYVDNIRRDLENGRLYFEIIGAPETGRVVRTLTFTGVCAFREEWFEEHDPDLLEQIIGLHQYPQEEGYRYLIHLDQSEMTFFTHAEPEVKEAEPLNDRADR